MCAKAREQIEDIPTFFKWVQALPRRPFVPNTKPTPHGRRFLLTGLYVGRLRNLLLRCCNLCFRILLRRRLLDEILF